MEKFQVLLGIQDRKGVHVLKQELMASEYRFKNLDPRILEECITERTYLVRDEKSPNLIKPIVTKDNRWRWECEVIDNPPVGTSVLMLIWNTITKKWELWSSKNGVYQIKTGEGIIGGLK